MEERIFTGAPAKGAMPAAGTRYGQAFWERLWRTAGIQSVGLFIVAWLLYSRLPLVAIALAGLAMLNLMWFAAAIRTTLAEAGQDGWGTAETAASAAVGGLLFLIISVAGYRAYMVPGGTSTETEDLAWAIWVMTSFPRAMLIMAGSFGFWRARLISNAGFAICVSAVVLVLAGGTTWVNDSVWAPHGVYSRLISPIIGLAWISAASWVLLTRGSTRHEGW